MHKVPKYLCLPTKYQRYNLYNIHKLFYKNEEQNMQVSSKTLQEVSISNEESINTKTDNTSRFDNTKTPAETINGGGESVEGAASVSKIEDIKDGNKKDSEGKTSPDDTEIVNTGSKTITQTIEPQENEMKPAGEKMVENAGDLTDGERKDILLDDVKEEKEQTEKDNKADPTDHDVNDYVKNAKNDSKVKIEDVNHHGQDENETVIKNKEEKRLDYEVGSEIEDANKVQVKEVNDNVEASRNEEDHTPVINKEEKPSTLKVEDTNKVQSGDMNEHVEESKKKNDQTSAKEKEANLSNQEMVEMVKKTEEDTNLKMEEEKGVVIDDVKPGKPAEKRNDVNPTDEGAVEKLEDASEVKTGDGVNDDRETSVKSDDDKEKVVEKPLESGKENNVKDESERAVARSPITNGQVGSAVR